MHYATQIGANALNLLRQLHGLSPKVEAKLRQPKVTAFIGPSGVHHKRELDSNTYSANSDSEGD